MKTICRILLITLIPSIFNRCKKVNDIIEISDSNFLNALIELGVDSNADGLLSPAEAEAVTVLNLDIKTISDLTGIGAFKNLKQLYCANNKLTRLKLDGNTF
jgi:Leucine-rich repeat (LRR) protein